ncbi:unnamed protein product [Calypogeia fissa]
MRVWASNALLQSLGLRVSSDCESAICYSKWSLRPSVVTEARAVSYLTLEFLSIAFRWTQQGNVPAKDSRNGRNTSEKYGSTTSKTSLSRPHLCRP